MIEREKTAAGFQVRIGPFATEEQARQIEELLRVLSPCLRTLPASVLAAVTAGQRHLETARGHYVVRVDGAPNARPKVDYSAGGTFTEVRTT